MALNGTLKDFGIADILQLIGQQQKTGDLVLSKDNENQAQVTISFENGSIVRTETSSRDGRELIGTMLVNAGIITPEELEQALEKQRANLGRLGDLLVEQGALKTEKFAEVVRLQTSETLYGLFHWEQGRYEFEQRQVDPDKMLIPLRAESVLMEGFRRVDEWKLVENVITDDGMTFEKRKELPPAKFGFGNDDDGEGEYKNIGKRERLCYGLAKSGATVGRITEQSLLGDFETRKALSNLVKNGFLKAIPGKTKGKRREDPAWAGTLARVLGVALVLIFAAAIAVRFDMLSFRFGFASAARVFTPPYQGLSSREQIDRIRCANSIFALEHGQLPGALEELVDSGLLTKGDLAFPWLEPYYYRRLDNGTAVLLPPLH